MGVRAPRGTDLALRARRRCPAEPRGCRAQACGPGGRAGCRLTHEEADGLGGAAQQHAGPHCAQRSADVGLPPLPGPPRKPLCGDSRGVRGGRGPGPRPRARAWPPPTFPWRSRPCGHCRPVSASQGLAQKSAGRVLGCPPHAHPSDRWDPQDRQEPSLTPLVCASPAARRGSARARGSCGGTPSPGACGRAEGAR